MNLLRSSSSSIGIRSREGLEELSSRMVKPRLTRNFAELAQSIDLLARGTDGGKGGDAISGGFVVRPRVADSMEAAHEILAPKQFDLQQHNREILSLQAKVQTSAQAHGQTFGPTDIDGLLEDFHQRTAYQKLIYSSWERSESDVEATHNRWAAEDWLNARQQFMESLGHRTQKWNTEVWDPHAHHQDQNRERQQNMVVIPGSGGPASSGRKFFGRQLTELAERHAGVVRAAMLATHQSRDANGYLPNKVYGTGNTIARDLVAVISETIQHRLQAQFDSAEDDMNQQELVCYKDVVRMLAEIVGEVSGELGSGPHSHGATPGVHSAICFPDSHVGVEAIRHTRKNLTLGAKRHLEQQKYDDWSFDLDEAVRGGRLRITQSAANETRQQRIRTYVGFCFHMATLVVPLDAAYSPRPAMISEAQQVKVPTWAFIFHCLRVGELDGAIAEMERCREAGIQIGDAPIHVVSCMQRLVTRGAELSTIERRELYEAMYRCQALFQLEYDKPTDLRQPQARDTYKALVLNLLSIGSDAEVMSELLFDVLGSNFQIEDFLWASLWFVMWSTVADLEENVQGGMAQGVGNLRAKGEQSLHQQILSMGGADYFSESNAFVYCKVLLCCQRYGDAILHLWRQRKALAAVHLTIICLHYGLVLPHKPLSYLPGSSSSSGGSSSSGLGPMAQLVRRTGGDSLSQMGDPTPAALLRVYTAAPFLLDYPEEAADYLISLNSKWQSPLQGVPDGVLSTERLLFEACKTKELSNMLTGVGREQLTRLVGTVVEDGSARGRSQGYLDIYISDEVDALLSKAAYHLLTQLRDSKGGVHLYLLAGKVEDAIEEMLGQLALGLVPNAAGMQAGSGGANREFWISESKRILARARRGGGANQPQLLLQRLGSRGASSRADYLPYLLASLECLLCLCTFVDAAMDRRPRDALQTLQAAGIVFDAPLARSYESYHRSVQQAFDPLLLIAMECTFFLFSEARQTGDFAMLGELKAWARGIVGVGSAISSHLQPATLSTLVRTEVALI